MFHAMFATPPPPPDVHIPPQEFILKKYEAIKKVKFDSEYSILYVQVCPVECPL